MESQIILTENNAFQSVGKALEKKCTEYFQIKDFLQYCIQLIFYEKTYLPKTVPSNVIQDSEYVKESILSNVYNINNVSFDDNIIDNSSKSNEMINAVSATLKNTLKIENSRNVLIAELKNSKRDDMVGLPNDIKQIMSKTIKALNKQEKEWLKEYLPVSSFAVDSCFFKIINNDEEVINGLFKISDEHEWNEAMAFGLIKKIRYLTNRNLADSNGQIFLSSINRSVEDEKRILQSENESKVSSNRNQQHINIPSIIYKLVNECKGDPERILRRSYELREDCKLVRILLGKKTDEGNGKEFKEQIEDVLKEIECKYFKSIEKIPFKSVMKKVYTLGVDMAFWQFGIALMGGEIKLDSPYDFLPLTKSLVQLAPSIISDKLAKRELSICYQTFFTEINTDNTIWDMPNGKELIRNCMKNI